MNNSCNPTTFSEFRLCYLVTISNEFVCVSGQWFIQKLINPNFLSSDLFSWWGQFIKNCHYYLSHHPCRPIENLYEIRDNWHQYQFLLCGLAFWAINCYFVVYLTLLIAKYTCISCLLTYQIFTRHTSEHIVIMELSHISTSEFETSWTKDPCTLYPCRNIEGAVC